jgi:hypothetical protein
LLFHIVLGGGRCPLIRRLMLQMVKLQAWLVFVIVVHQLLAAEEKT